MVRKKESDWTAGQDDGLRGKGQRRVTVWCGTRRSNSSARSRKQSELTRFIVSVGRVYLFSGSSCFNRASTLTDETLWSTVEPLLCISGDFTEAYHFFESREKRIEFVFCSCLQ